MIKLVECIDDNFGLLDDLQHLLLLTNEERAEFDALLTDLPPHDPLKRHSEEFYLELKMLARRMPLRLLRMLDRFKLNPTAFPKGYLVFRNLPADTSRCTPRTHKDPICDPTTKGEWVNMLISNYLGDTTSVANEYDGRYPNPIVPQELLAAEPSSAGSLSRLGWHTDQITSGPAQPEWLALTCITPAPEGTGTTTIASLCDVLPRISPAARAALRQANYSVDPPASNKGQIKPVITSVLGGDELAPYLTFQEGGTHITEPTNEAARLALQELVDALDASRQDISLGRGDTLLFRNGKVGWNTCHGRSLFRPSWYNAEFQRNRFLVRSYIHASIVPIQHLCYPNSRVLVPASLYRAAFA